MHKNFSGDPIVSAHVANNYRVLHIPAAVSIGEPLIVTVTLSADSSSYCQGVSNATQQLKHLLVQSHQSL